MEVFRNAEQVRAPKSCGSNTALLYRISSTTTADQGLYFCRARNANGTVAELLLGNMTIVGKHIIRKITAALHNDFFSTIMRSFNY